MKLTDKLLQWTDKALDFALGTPVPAKWEQDIEADERLAAIQRHPAGKRLQAGDPDPVA